MASLVEKEETGRTKTKHMINSHFGDAYNLNAFKTPHAAEDSGNI